MLCELLHLLSQEILIRIVKKERLRSLFFYTVFIKYIIGAYTMNIVWIHEMNQQHKTARTLLQHWLVILERTWLRRWPTLSSAVQSAGLLRRYSNTSAFRKHPQRQQPHAATLVSFLHPIHLTHTAAPNIEHQAEISKNPQLTLSDEFSFNNKIKYISLLGKDLAYVT